MAAIQKRQTAKLVRISDLKKGSFSKGDEQLPSHLEVSGEIISRINLVGVVVSELDEETMSSILVDDGSGNIRVSSFQSGSFDWCSVGDSIMVIGWIREYGSERFVSSEVVKKVDSSLISLRMLELEKNRLLKKEVHREELSADKLLDLIRKNDGGAGVSIEDVLKKTNNYQAEQLIKQLIKKGAVFEVKPGVIKALE